MSKTIKNLNPDTVARINCALEDDPFISKTELAKRVGLSRTGLYAYLRSMKGQMERVCERRQALEERRVMTFLDLLEQVTESEKGVRETIESLRRWPSPMVASKIFHGYSTLARQQQLLGQLMTGGSRR